jgi:hypothetical protein
LLLHKTLGIMVFCSGLKCSPEPTTMPTGRTAVAATSFADIDAALTRLDPQGWILTDTSQRVQLLQQVMENCLKLASKFADLGVASHGSYGQGNGEEM